MFYVVCECQCRFITIAGVSTSSVSCPSVEGWTALAALSLVA